ncbi:MAG: DUF4976 domain-containing protein [Lentisphaerae bacterium]|nr:MAG: DUF4976 domain-containing protein [Lentisphaerota bacterium]
MAAKSYNILYLMTDQWRWDTLFQPGHICQTPNLDRLAERSTVFNRAYTPCPLCTPARGSIFTGLWQFQNRLMDNNGPYWPHMQLARRFRTYLERLQENGAFNVTYSGKWHCGNGNLNERGIRDVRQSDGGTCPEDERYRYPNVKLLPGHFKPYYGAYDEGVHIDERRVNAGLDQLEQLIAGDRPFCSVISLSAPHFPHFVPRAFRDMYELPDDFMPDNFCEPFSEKNKPFIQQLINFPAQDTTVLTPEDWREMCRHYWAFCTWADAQIGRVLDFCDRHHLWENTVIAFSPDHGEMLGAHGKFDKGPDVYEETTHVPLIIFDPATRSPRNPDSFVSLRDLFPTLISLAGADHILSEDECRRSYWHTDHDHVFMTYDLYHGREFPLRAIRTSRYKYVWIPNDKCELYDLEHDPGERNNLIDDPQYTDLIHQLDTKLKTWMEKEGDHLSHRQWFLDPGAYIDGRGSGEMHPWPQGCFPKRG